MTFDLGDLLRRRKPEKRLAQLVASSMSSMLTATDVPSGRVPLVIDTNVYIAEAAGLLPPEAEVLLDRPSCSIARFAWRS